MGLLTRFLRRSTLRIASVVFCSPELLPAKSERFASLPSFNKKSNKEDDQPKQNHQNENNEMSLETSTTTSTRTLYLIQSMQWSSVLFDLLDLVNAVLDIALAVQLSRSPNSTNNVTYVITIILGVILGRMVLFRGTWLLFQGGMQVPDAEILLGQCLSSEGDNDDNHRPNKNLVAFQLLYCLAYTEAAAFMFETFPSLGTYAFWMVMNFPPAPLEKFDKVNVMLSIILGLSIAVGLLLATLVTHIWKGYRRLRHAPETWYHTVYQASVLLLEGLVAAAMMSFIWEITTVAWKVAILEEEAAVPSGELLWGLITICSDLKNGARLDSFCDERAFLVRVGLAWLFGAYFSFFVFFRPARWDFTDSASSLPSFKTGAIQPSISVVQPTSNARDSPSVALDDGSSTLFAQQELDDDNLEQGKRKTSALSGQMLEQSSDFLSSAAFLSSDDSVLVVHRDTADCPESCHQDAAMMEIHVNLSASTIDPSNMNCAHGDKGFEMSTTTRISHETFRESRVSLASF